MFGGEQWQRCTLATALLFPGAGAIFAVCLVSYEFSLLNIQLWDVSLAGVNFVVFFIVNSILWHQDSDGAGG